MKHDYFVNWIGRRGEFYIDARDIVNFVSYLGSNKKEYTTEVWNYKYR